MDQISEDIVKVLAAFVKVARHARNIPHPQIPVELLRREGVEAESLAERVLGEEQYQKVCDLAFKEK